MCRARHPPYPAFPRGRGEIVDELASPVLFGETGELKPALYTLRVLHTGIHLMRTGDALNDLLIRVRLHHG